MDAAAYNRIDVVRALIARGAQVKARNHEGLDALWLAVRQYPSLELVTLLIDEGCDLNTKDQMGVSVLMKAAQADRDDLIPTLVSRGAAVNAVDKNGKTALRHAESAGKTKAIAALREAGAK